MCITSIALTGMIWPFSFDFFRPVRKYVSKRSYFRRFRRTLKDSSNLPEKEKTESQTCCPSCFSPFDKGKKRKLIDTCGHQRCYTCIFTTDHCPLCNPQTQVKNQSRRPVSHCPVSVQTSKPTTLSLDNQQLPAFRKDRRFLPNRFQKLSCRWQLGERPHSAHEISNVEIHSQMDPETTENIPNRHCAGNKTRIHINNDGNNLRRNDIQGSNMSSLSSKRDEYQVYAQGDISREQSMSSLMSISSRSSFGPIEALKINDERAQIYNPRFSIMQSSSISLAISTDTSVNTSTEKVEQVQQLRLKPLYFEVPQSERDPPFLGRQWIFKEIEKMVSTTNSQVMTVIGGPGTGKTSMILQLVDYSSFGRKWEETFYQNTQDIYCKIKDLGYSVDRDSDQMSISSRESLQRYNEVSVLHRLAAQVVGYHFCQLDYNATCLVPDFIHSLAAQLCQAPQLSEYRDLLLKEPKYQALLCIDSCMANPDAAFIEGIIEPLQLLTKSSVKNSYSAFIVIDSIHEAEEHRSPERNSIASFLSKHAKLLPTWLKLIITVESGKEDIISSVNPYSISLDMKPITSRIQNDLVAYIHNRINNDIYIQKNINNARKKEEGCLLLRFSDYLATISKGSFLYTKLTLGLLQKGHLVVKSSSFSILPVSLNQVFMLAFSIHFPSSSSFNKVSPILEVCLASLYPLTPLEVYHSLNARFEIPTLTWFDFMQRLQLLTTLEILVQRQDGSLMFSHPALREWLIRRETNQTTKFICDIRNGHANLGLRMARLEAPLSPEQGLVFAHHLLEANVFGTFLQNSLSRQLQALWFQHCLLNPSLCLVHERNIFSPNIRVSRLLLEASVDPNNTIEFMKHIPILTIASELGHADFVSLLLEFGANPNIQQVETGLTPLMAASQKGNLEVLRLLLSASSKVHLKDNFGKTALSYAVENGSVEIIDLLLKCQWPDQNIFKTALNNAFVTSAGKGHLEVCQHLLKEKSVDINDCDTISGHTGLTYASLQGRFEICKLLLQKAKFTCSQNGTSPIIWAVKGNNVEVLQLLISACRTMVNQMDKEGKSALLWAAASNNIEALKILLNAGASINAKDMEELSALSWACRENNLKAAQHLLECKAEIESVDNKGRTALYSALPHNDGEILTLLLKHGANIEHKDYGGNTAFEGAIRGKYLLAVSKLLHRGVKIGPKVWCLAQAQPNMLLLLLHKLLSDGVVLYKKEKFQEAGQRFQYAIRKFPDKELQGGKKTKFQQLKFYLLLGLSRCYRRMNEYNLSIKSADEALKIRPQSYEALYVRSKVKHEAGAFQEALADVTHALQLAHSDPSVVQGLQNLRAEILTSSKVVCPLEGIDNDNSRSPELKRSVMEVSHLGMHSVAEQCRTSISRERDSKQIKIPFGLSNEMTSPVH